MQSGKDEVPRKGVATTPWWFCRNFPMKRFLLFLPFLAACSNTLQMPQMPQMPQITNYLSPYRIDVRQGNFVTQEMVAQLKPGLTRDQVRFILGSPLVADMFHADRWDYVYRYRRGREEVQQRTLTVFFVDNKLTRVAGDVVAEDGSKSEASRPAAQVIDIPAPAAAGAVAKEKNAEEKNAEEKK